MSTKIETDQIREKMMNFIAENRDLSINNFSSSHSFKESGIDSFKIIELIVFLESTFQLKFPESEYTADNLKSVDSILNCALKFNSKI